MACFYVLVKEVACFLICAVLVTLTDGNPKMSSSVSTSSMAEDGICQSIATADLELMAKILVIVPGSGSPFSLFYGG